MVCLADDLVGWKDFPKGLRVLLLDKDSASASETKLKLEAMDYVVTLFCNENDALETISRSAESFHVAIVEITNGNSSGGFRFLELVRDLPTIVVSNFRCLNTMMKCLALGAAEFLEKPLSEDKLRNLWQHVVHKAFNAGKSAISNSLKPIKETVASLLRLESETADPENGTPLLAGALDKHQPVSSQEDIETREKFPAPSTPQLEQGIRLTDDGDNKPNCSIDDVKTLLKNSSCSKSKSVDITINNLNDVVSNREAAEDEVDSVDGSRSDECSAFKECSLPPLNNSDNSDSAAKDPETEKPCDHANSNSHANKTNKKKMKVDWTPELHRKFVQAVEQLGMDQAIPSKILELMKAEGLTRHNVASHLQKYRMHRRHILPKDDDKRWKQQRENTPMRYVQRPLVPVSPYPCHYGYPPSQVYPAWGHPALHHSAPVPVWSHAAFSPWPRPPESWHWRPYSGVHADAWGCPVVRPYGQYSIPTQSTAVDNCLDAIGDLNKDVRDFSDVHVADEVIDEVVKEAMSKPWLPLPLGLKPPSTDSVLAELHRQGVSSIPPDLPLHHHHRPQSRSLS